MKDVTHNTGRMITIGMNSKYRQLNLHPGIFFGKLPAVSSLTACRDRASEPILDMIHFFI